MNVTSVNMNTPVKRQRKSHPGLVGAGITAGVLATSTAASWIRRPDQMKEIVSQCGGKNNYIKTFILGGAILTALGAVANKILAGIASAITPKKPPKAAN